MVPYGDTCDQAASRPFFETVIRGDSRDGLVQFLVYRLSSESESRLQLIGSGVRDNEASARTAAEQMVMRLTA